MIKSLMLFCLLMGALLSGVQGAEQRFPSKLVLEDGTVYEDVRLISQTPAEVVVRYSGGVKNIKIADLSEEVQQLLNYSETEAAAVQRAQEEKDVLLQQQYEKAMKERALKKALADKKKHVFMIRGHVHRVLDGGILIQAGEPTDLVYYGVRSSESEAAKRQYKSYSEPRPIREFGVLYLIGHPDLEEFTDGDVVDVDVYRDGIFKYKEETRKQFVFLKSY